MPQNWISSFVDLHDHWIYITHGNNLWELPSSDRYTHWFAPLHPIVSLTLRSHQLQFHLSFAFLCLLFAHLCPLTCPRRHLNSLPSFSIWWIYICYHYWYILINVCQSFVFFISPTVSMFLLTLLVFFWVYYICCLTPLFSCTILKDMFFFLLFF